MSLKNRIRLEYLPDPAPDQSVDFVHEILFTKKAGFNPQHVQETYEMVVYVAGQLDLKVYDAVYSCTAGDMMLLAPGAPHGGNRYDCLLDRYTVLLGRRAMDVFGPAGEQLRGVFPTEGCRLVRLPPERFSEVTALLSSADLALHAPQQAGLAHVEAFSDILQVLLLLARHRAEETNVAAPSQTLSRILAYIESNYASLRGEEELCRVFGISRSGLWRLFTAQLGQTPGAYLRRMRLNRARLLLERGTSVTEAAMEVGFGDASHFIRLFREAFGVTPLQYKNSRSHNAHKIPLNEGQNML